MRTKQLFVYKQQLNLGRKLGTEYSAFKYLSPPFLVATTDVHSKAVVLLMLIYCFMYFPLFVGVLCWSLFWYAFLCVLSSLQSS